MAVLQPIVWNIAVRCGIRIKVRPERYSPSIQLRACRYIFWFSVTTCDEPVRADRRDFIIF